MIRVVMKSLILALGISAIAQPAFAYDRMQRSDCQAAWRSAATMFGAPGLGGASQSVTPDGWCRVRRSDPLLAGSNFDTLDWRVDGIKTFLANEVTPTAFAVRINGLQLDQGPSGQNTALAGTPPLAFSAEVQALPETRQLILQEARLTSPQGDEIYLTGVFGRVDVSSVSMAQVSTGSVMIERLNARVRLNGWVENQLIPDLDIEYRGNPTALRDMIIDRFAMVPDAILAPNTRANVAAFAGDAAAPRGTLEFSFQAQPGLGMLQVGQYFYRMSLTSNSNDGPAELPFFFDGITLGVLWSPDAQ